MSLSTQPYKGARDFYPEDKRLQKYIFSIWRKVAESFGYEEYDAPILEPLDLYRAKSGEEIVNEQTYSFTDRGDRQLAIRPEMTPTVSRLVAARRQELPYPLRLYSIPNLWRYERPQRGRLREHWQLNVDLFGVAGLEAEHEMLMIASEIMKAFKAQNHMYVIRINSRRLMDFVLKDWLGLDEVQSQSIAKLIDRMHKMDYATFAAQLDAFFTPSQRTSGASDRLLDFLKAESLEKIDPALATHSSVQSLKQLLALAEKSKILNVVFDATLMRGFDYYTDIVFEVFDTHPDNNRSLFGGGRYDGLVGLFGVEPLPTIGFGMGDVSLLNFLETHELLPKLKPSADAYVVIIGDIYESAQSAIQELREMGLKLAVDNTKRTADKQFKTADKLGLPYAVIIGEQELQENQLTLKNLSTSESVKLSLQRIVSTIKDHRNN